MKKEIASFAAICIAAVGLLTACGKSNEDLIIGTWDVTQTMLTYHMSPSEVYSDTSDVPSTDIWFFTFRDNNTGTIVHTPDNVDFTYTIDDDRLSITTPEYLDGGNGTYMDTQVFTIESLDKKEAVISQKSDFEYHRIFMKKR